MRIEKDSMGEMSVPDEALWGASTQRAVLNFPISSLRLQRRFIRSIGVIKLAAAKTNLGLGLLAADKADAIVKAAAEVSEGKHFDHFVVDVFQTGSGTSTNMNANEVISHLALKIIGGTPSEKGLIHPNDHVNMCQSSNDVIPTAIHVAAATALNQELYPALEKLANEMERKSSEFATVIKTGRTHLQDATPITLGQEFSGYAAQIRNAIVRIKRSETAILELALGGTAVGTGLNTHPQFAGRAISEISKLTGLPFVETRNHFQAQSCQDTALELSGQLRALAVAMFKIANDIRWLSSGPRCAIGEINLPETQPGSSIMPAKVNPVICESVMMVATHVAGNDAAVAFSAQHGNFELNTMLPVIAYNLLESIELLAKAALNFESRCISGISANTERCLDFAEKSLATCTSLAPKVGYDLAAKIAKKALAENKTVREAAAEMKVLAPDELDKVLNLLDMTKPGL